LNDAPHTGVDPDDATTWIKEPPGTDEARQKRREKKKSNGQHRGDVPPGADIPGDQPGALRLRYGFDATAAQPIGTIVEGLLHAGSVTLIYGPPKSGKSFLATDLALAVTAELPDWMGHRIVRPGPVLCVACEGHAGIWKRLAAAAQERRWDEATFPKGFILATGRPKVIRMDANGMHFAPDPSAILAALDDAKQRGMKPVAIVIDTVFRSFGEGNVNASPDMNVYLAAVAVLTDQGYAVALVHHEIKSGGTPAGSVSLIGGADTIIHVWRKDETSDRWPRTTPRPRPAPSPWKWSRSAWTRMGDPPRPASSMTGAPRPTLRPGRNEDDSRPRPAPKPPSRGSSTSSYATCWRTRVRARTSLSTPMHRQSGPSAGPDCGGQ
jgi:hypothetical protein